MDRPPLHLELLVPSPDHGAVLEVVGLGTLPSYEAQLEPDTTAIMFVQQTLEDRLGLRTPVLETHVPPDPGRTGAEPVVALAVCERPPAGWEPPPGLGWHRLDAFLEGVAPGRVPHLVAYEPVEGWLLLDDVGATDAEAASSAVRRGAVDAVADEPAPPARLQTAIDAVVGLQRRLLGREDELRALGCPDRRLATLADEVARAVGGSPALPGVTLPPERIATLVEWVRDRAAWLDAVGLPDVMLHGDFHTDNVLFAADGPVVIDWCDAAIGHPLMEIAAFFEDVGDPELCDACWKHWLEALAPLGDVNAVRAERETVEGLADAYQVVTYADIVRNIEPANRYQLSDGSRHFSTGWTDECQRNCPLQAVFSRAPGRYGDDRPRATFAGESVRVVSPQCPRAWRSRAPAVRKATGMTRRHRAVLAVSALAAVLVPLAAPVTAAAPASDAVAPDVGEWIVSVGDSYISGEAGRWAGNSNRSSAYSDALGPTAYYDNPGGTAETIPGCHRSKSAEVYIGGGVNGLNLACSGAETVTTTGSEGFKPGLDFYADGAGNLGQAAMLQAFAAENDVDAVVVSVGGNDFEFGTIVAQCVEDFLTSFSFAKNFCNDDANVEAIFTDANRAVVRADIVTALTNVSTAMTNAGYAAGDWTMLVQTYPSPIPRGDGFRYGQSGFKRQTKGGCGFWNADADWANDTALKLINKTVNEAVVQSGLTNTERLNLISAFNGRRLCEDTVGLYEEKGLTSWTQPTAVDKTEWFDQIRITDAGPYEMQESLHPNYWAQLALRSCLRQAYNNGDVRSGACRISGTGLFNGEPRMQLR